MPLIVGSKGFLLANMKVIPGYFHRQENKRKLQAVELPSSSILLLLIMLGCPSGQQPIKNGGSLACATKDKMADGSGFLSPLPCVLTNF